MAIVKSKLCSLLCSCVLLTSGCASLKFNVQDNRFIIPENSGDTLSGKIGVGYGSKTSIVLVDSISVDTPVIDKPHMTKENGGNIHLEMALLKQLDVFLNASGLGAKFQILGDTEKEAKKGNTSLALAVTDDLGTRTESEEFTLFSTGYKNELKLEYHVFDFMFLLGHRISQSNLLYLNLAYQYISAKGTITQTATGTSEITNIDVPEANGNQITILLGSQITLGERFYIMIEPGLSLAKWPKADNLNRFVLGMELGVLF